MGEENEFQTGYTYDKLMLNHRCSWAENHHETPRRLSSILERCEQLKLFERCLFVPCSQANDEEILRFHSERLLKILSEAPMENIEDLKKFCRQFDDVFLNEVKRNV